MGKLAKAGPESSLYILTASVLLNPLWTCNEVSLRCSFVVASRPYTCAFGCYLLYLVVLLLLLCLLIAVLACHSTPSWLPANEPP